MPAEYQLGADIKSPAWGGLILPRLCIGRWVLVDQVLTLSLSRPLQALALTTPQTHSCPCSC